MNTPLRISAAVLLSGALIAHSQTPPSQPIAPSVPIPAKPVAPESLPLVPGGGKVVPPSQPLSNGTAIGAAKSPSDPSTYPARYRALLSQSMSSFHTRDFKGAEAALVKADAIMPPTSWSLNIRGAIAIEQKQWDEGLRYSIDALRIDPGFYPAKFNLCEIPFYQGKYAEARALWEKLLASQPKDELLIYRIFLTYLLEGDAVNTEVWLKKIPFPSETPAYQYAHAAFYFHNEQLAKKANEMERSKEAGDKAAEWTKSAEFIWPEQKRANFIDVLMHLGWVRREELPTN